MKSNDKYTEKSLLIKWLRLGVGLLILTAVFGFFSSGYTLPGVFGEVLRHNQANDIDASPLFYSDVENMSELEDGVQKLRQEAKLRDTE
ncbi:MAG: hypothetical protein GY839_21020 [candidate division Zixibacteria bacterium]|nr:hypothetical protein [candidate division Zixibacteria bacterium]